MFKNMNKKQLAKCLNSVAAVVANYQNNKNKYDDLIKKYLKK